LISRVLGLGTNFLIFLSAYVSAQAVRDSRRRGAGPGDGGDGEGAAELGGLESTTQANE